jgi:hypothetical protein
MSCGPSAVMATVCSVWLPSAVCLSSGGCSRKRHELRAVGGDGDGVLGLVAVRRLPVVGWLLTEAS